MTRLGLTPDHLLATTWGGEQPYRYVACIPGLTVLAGETLALVGSGAADLRDRLTAAIGDTAPLEGPGAAARGTLRIHAQQAARVGLQAIAVSDPFAVPLEAAARDLAIADLAGVASLGLTCVVDLADPTVAALVADRIVVVRNALPITAYPVLAPIPRRAADVAAVLARTRQRLTAVGA